jgi:hypothetical protein
LIFGIFSNHVHVKFRRFEKTFLQWRHLWNPINKYPPVFQFP